MEADKGTFIKAYLMISREGWALDGAVLSYLHVGFYIV